MFNLDNYYEKFENKVWMSSPTMYQESVRYDVPETYETNWMSTVEENINKVEKQSSEKVEFKYTIAFFAGTAPCIWQ